MKIRNFKKAIRRAGYYKYLTPRILNRIYGKDDCEYVYYTCSKLKATLRMKDGKFISFSTDCNNKNKLSEYNR